jgi:plasmid segregation protein ParM
MAKKTLLAAVDDGYAQTKLYGENENGEIVKFRMRSSVRPGRYGLGAISGTGSVGLYDTEDGPFTVSEDIEAENTQFDGFHLSTMNRVLVNHALVSAGYGGKDVDVITGLPVADFFINGLKDEEKVGQKRANLLKDVSLTSGEGKVPSIKNVQVGCQAVAAWVDYALGDDIKERVEIEGAVAIVDIGGRTTDVATVISGQSVDHARSGTQNIGVLDVYKAVEAAILAQFKIRDRFPLNAIDQAVRTGSIPLWGKNNDVTELVQGIIREHESKIAREVERRIGSGAAMNAVVFVGGGSALFSKISENFPNGVMVEDPEFANARGLYKYSRYSKA